MGTQSNDLHGSAPDYSSVALLIIDVMNTLDFPGGKKLLKQALPMAEKIADLKKRAKNFGIPVVYANDNYGRWKSDFHQVVEQSLQREKPGFPVAYSLQPDEDDYFVIKPKHSGFFSTTLETLLSYLGVEKLIITGVQTEICVLFTANDAFMREFQVIVPKDCVASEEEREREHALRLMEKTLKADITPGHQLPLSTFMTEQEKVEKNL